MARGPTTNRQSPLRFIGACNGKVLEARRVDRGADACTDLKKGTEADVQRPCTSPQIRGLATNRQRNMAWDPAPVDGLPDRTFRRGGGAHRAGVR